MGLEPRSSDCFCSCLCSSKSSLFVLRGLVRRTRREVFKKLPRGFPPHSGARPWPQPSSFTIPEAMVCLGRSIQGGWAACPSPAADLCPELVSVPFLMPERGACWAARGPSCPQNDNCFCPGRGAETFWGGGLCIFLPLLNSQTSACPTGSQGICPNACPKAFQGLRSGS